jgi:hypothetical protein
MSMLIAFSDIWMIKFELLISIDYQLMIIYSSVVVFFSVALLWRKENTIWEDLAYLYIYTMEHMDYNIRQETGETYRDDLLSMISS